MSLPSAFQGSHWVVEGEADYAVEYQAGLAYPVLVHCVWWETNELGERRVREQKTFRLVEVKEPKL